MRSEYVKQILARTPEETHKFVDKYTDLVVLIRQIMKEKKMTQKSLAEKLGKKPSEINKWLSANHNLTLRSICKLEVELDEILLVVPRKPLFSGEIKSRISSQTAPLKDKLGVDLDRLSYVTPIVSKAKEDVERQAA